jgi:hypothetical protein
VRLLAFTLLFAVAVEPGWQADQLHRFDVASIKKNPLGGARVSIDTP